MAMSCLWFGRIPSCARPKSSNSPTTSPRRPAWAWSGLPEDPRAGAGRRRCGPASAHRRGHRPDRAQLPGLAGVGQERLRRHREPTQRQVFQAGHGHQAADRAWSAEGARTRGQRLGNRVFVRLHEQFAAAAKSVNRPCGPSVNRPVRALANCVQNSPGKAAACSDRPASRLTSIGLRATAMQ